ncbi:ABC1 family protein [Colletotrichum higginsianum]|uniref:ABC1 family protein n=2 Tax=Colletotrichum higginsianum TaxID=80884 RepID=H1V5U8_COLHI|nr:ABC1 family protein [Colletotrichum higginsianum IMI 349063]OBR07304.1 ABC1 family protein [Colletotrichum higginsianum IMI 349063]TIC92782.1 ABC1 family protein MCP2-like protein [Colletotrichum higginsianum]CCF35600.1 ABC1 family protein [Colletotrichum higginsianum]
MKAFSLFSLPLRRLATRRSWTCSECRAGPTAQQQQQQQYSRSSQRQQWFGNNATRGFSSTSTRAAVARAVPKNGSSGSGSGGGRKGGRVLLLASGGGAAAASALAFTDDIKHGYEAAERAGRVAAALAVCINDYRTTLNQKEKIEDPELQSRILKDCHQRCADRTLKVLEKNGGIFIKLGQHLSAMNYLLPQEWTNTFIPLQDKCPVSSFESIEEMFRNDIGTELWDYFSEFSNEPIGAASLAQVHTATVKETGMPVAVKVQHPGLGQWSQLDLALTRFTFSTLKRFFPEYDLEWLSAEMDVSLPKELDFREEERNANRTREHFAKLPEHPLVVPGVLWAKERILVMERVSGHRLDDLAYLDANGIDRDEVSACLARIFNEMIFGHDAPLHCDPHGGNLAIRKNESRRGLRGGHNFDIILYDHGLYRDIPRDLQRSYAKMWLAVIDGDMKRMRTYAKEVANINDEQFPLFASAITGRDWSVLNSEGSVLQTRTADEKKEMGDALQEGLIVDLVQLLGQVPRIILLILKTNDLTRSLDENLHTRQGPIRSFLILARYCTRTVFEEQLEDLKRRGSLLWPPNTFRLVSAWIGFLRVEVKLGAFELFLSVKRALGLKGVEFPAPGM